jgi:hypothetical protein
MSLLAFILGAGTALALSSYDKTEKSTTYAKGGKLKTLKYAYAKGGSIYIGSVNKLIDFVYFNPITAASMTDEQIGKKFYLPTNVAGKIRMAVKKNYTNKEIYDILRE